MSKIIVITTVKCPACVAMKNTLESLMKDMDFCYEVYNLDDPGGYELASKYNMSSAPLTIINDEPLVGFPGQHKVKEFLVSHGVQTRCA